MPLFDPNACLDLLAAHMAEHAAGGALEYTGTPRAVWLGQADEAYSTEPYSTVIPYGGELAWVPVARRAVQVMTYAKDPEAGRIRAAALFQSLQDAQGRPKRMIDLGGGYRLLGVALRMPQVVAAGDDGRTLVAFNFDASAVAL